jgi:hypothetical protein
VAIRLETEPPADARVHLRVGESLTVEVDPKVLDWVGGDDTFSTVLSTNDPCDATCAAARRTFTATRAGTAVITTVRHCEGRGAMCALGPAVVVAVTA